MTSSSSPGSRVDGAMAILRARGERVTQARRAVVEVLDATAEHLDADEIAARAEASAPGLHRTTVYRALATLGDLGMVSHTHVGGAAAVYHLTIDDPRLATAPSVHAHAQCTVCSAVFDIPVASFEALTADLMSDLGFQLEPEHAALLGRCSACRTSNA
ncbi:Fur family transcriptional regulator [Nocardioides currus]|nr:transcriptional repressor [Nocardioides currus]